MYVERAVILLVLFLFLGGTTAEQKKRTKVLILGGGLSGITAAKTLLDNGVTDFLILEGRNYTGGRIHSVPFAGLMVEAGANWIHLIESSATAPLVKRKDDKNMNAISCNYSDVIVRDEKGQDITDVKVVQKYHKVVEERLEEFKEARKSRSASDIPARVGLQLMGWKSRRPIEKVIEYYKIDFENAKRPELVSFSNIIFAGKDFFVSDQRGLWFMYEDLYKPLSNRTLLRKTVKNVKYSSDAVEVSTSDGQTFSADYALCTFSTGVLASDMVSFDPPLPEDKKEAIFKNPLSLYTKIFLKFPRKFWDDHEYILHASRQRGRWPIFQDLDRPGILPLGSGILLATLTEDEARRVEGQTDNETQAELMKTLRDIYGQNIPDPTAIYYHRWSRDPYTLGSYSEPVVGMTSKDFEKLAERVDRLYFAGEATSEDWYGYQQGAHLTGKAKGQMIADEVLGRSDKRKPKSGAPVAKSSCIFLVFMACAWFGHTSLLA